MNVFKNGYYGMHEGRLYRIGKRYETAAELCSEDREDLSNGFACSHSESFIRKYGFVCIKDVPKSELTEVYRIRTFAQYKDIKLYVYKANRDHTLILLCPQLLSDFSEDDRRIRDKLTGMGFYVFETEKAGHTYAKNVPPDDPDMQLFQIREKIDIDKLSYEF